LKAQKNVNAFKTDLAGAIQALKNNWNDWQSAWDAFVLDWMYVSSEPFSTPQKATLKATPLDVLWTHREVLYQHALMELLLPYASFNNSTSEAQWNMAVEQVVVETDWTIDRVGQEQINNRALVLFECLTGKWVRTKQRNLYQSIITEQNDGFTDEKAASSAPNGYIEESVHQLLMGSGKTSVLTPLLALHRHLRFVQGIWNKHTLEPLKRYAIDQLQGIQSSIASNKAALDIQFSKLQTEHTIVKQLVPLITKTINTFTSS